MSTTKYLFVDGGYLMKVAELFSKKYFNAAEVEISPSGLSCQYQKTFYYDCPTPKRANETEEEHAARLGRQDSFDRELLHARGVHVFKGTTRRVARRARQKQVDVAIAVDMLSHAYRRNMDEVTLLSGDLDFKPLVDALVRDGMFVTVWCEPTSASEDLIMAADARKVLNLRQLHEMTTPQFKKAHPIPNFTSMDCQPRGPLLRKGNTAKGEPIELREKDGLYTLVIPDQQDSGQETVSSHPDADYLEFFFKDQRCEIFWETEPQSAQQVEEADAGNAPK